MAKQVESGHYKYGRIEPQTQQGPRPRYCGVFGVVKGSNIESNGHLEWSHICEGIIKTSRWCAYRIGPGDNGSGTRTDLLKSFDTKKDAINWLKGGYRGYDYTTTY